MVAFYRKSLLFNIICMKKEKYIRHVQYFYPSPRDRENPNLKPSSSGQRRVYVVVCKP